MSRDRLSALVFLALAIFVALQSRGLKLGALQQPGPGFFPFWGAVILGALSLLLLVSARRDAAPASAAERSWMPLLVAAAVLAYVLLLERLGFVTVTFLFLLLLFRAVRRGWMLSALAAVGGAGGSWALFQLWLKTPLPRGPFGF